MATARDKLIAEWHERLAAAEAVDPAIASRPAWLARLQIRLYRFLLSLYGDGDWSRSAPQTNSAEDSSVVFDSAAALPLAGKPPKSIGQIQAVLKSVANAQTSAAEPGPLVQGLQPECWVTLALVSAKNRHRIEGLADELRRKNIETRLRHHGRRHTLEVRAQDRLEAARFVRDLQRRPIPNRVVSARASQVIVVRRPEPGPLLHYLPHIVLIATAVGPMLGWLAVLGADIRLQCSGRPDTWPGNGEPLSWLAFVGGWIFGATAIVMLTALVDSIIVAAREYHRELQLKSQSHQNQPVGMAWHCLAAGVFIGPFAGLIAVGASGARPENQGLVFFAGWALSVAVAGVVYLARFVD